MWESNAHACRHAHLKCCGSGPQQSDFRAILRWRKHQRAPSLRLCSCTGAAHRSGSSAVRRSSRSASAAIWRLSPSPPASSAAKSRFTIGLLTSRHTCRQPQERLRYHHRDYSTSAGADLPSKHRLDTSTGEAMQALLLVPRWQMRTTGSAGGKATQRVFSLLGARRARGHGVLLPKAEGAADVVLKVLLRERRAAQHLLGKGALGVHHQLQHLVVGAPGEQDAACVLTRYALSVSKYMCFVHARRAKRCEEGNKHTVLNLLAPCTLLNRA